MLPCQYRPTSCATLQQGQCKGQHNLRGRRGALYPIIPGCAQWQFVSPYMQRKSCGAPWSCRKHGHCLSRTMSLLSEVLVLSSTSHVVRMLRKTSKPGSSRNVKNAYKPWGGFGLEYRSCIRGAARCFSLYKTSMSSSTYTSPVHTENHIASRQHQKAYATRHTTHASRAQAAWTWTHAAIFLMWHLIRALSPYSDVDRTAVARKE